MLDRIWGRAAKRRAGIGSLAMMAFVFANCAYAQTAAAGVHGALEVTSGLGAKLYALPDDAAETAAKAAMQADPQNAGKVLALSKAEAARRQYREAVATCTRGLTTAPQNADLYVERGHRELGLRQFRPAMADLERAAQLNPANLDAHYHLGLSHYFLGQFADAAAAFAKARDLAKSNDSLIDCSNWLYVSLRRAGKEPEAAAALARITPQVTNTEPHLYFYLRLLRFYQGKVTAQELVPPKPTRPEDLEGELSFNTTSYGLGNWKIYQQHDLPGATAIFRRVVTGEAWNSWGFIGSEVELQRTKR